MRFNQTTDLTSPHSIKRSILGVFVAFICALFAAGCSSGGSGGNDFVASPGGGAGNGGAPAGNGSVTFNFVRAQTAVQVPTNTTSLRFEFFSGLQGGGALVFKDTRAFANTITIDNVPSSARSSVVTALTTEGFPVRTFTVDLTVSAGGSTTVDATAGTSAPVTVSGLTGPSQVSLGLGDTSQIVISAQFSNGDVVELSGALASQVAFTSNDMTVVSVSTDGTLTTGLAGTTSVNASFMGQSVNVTVVVGNGVKPLPTVLSLAITTVEAQPVNLPRGTVSQPITVTVTREDAPSQNLTAANGVEFTFTGTGITVNANNQIAVATDAPLGTQTLTARYEGQQASIEVTVNDATVQQGSLTASPASVSLPFGGFEQQIAISATFTNNQTVTLNPDGQVSYPVTGTNVTINDTTGVLTTNATGTAGTETVTITTNADANINLPGGVTIDVPVTVGSVTVQSLTVTPSVVPQTGMVFAPGQTQEFVVVANLSNNTTVNVSDFASLQLQVTSGGSSVVANGKQVVAIAPTPMNTPAVVSFNIPNSGLPAPATVNVTVVSEVISNFADIEYRFGGITIPANKTVNLPRGYVGVFEVFATFNTGITRRLRADEYEIRGENPTNGSNGAAIELFRDGYMPQAINGNFIDGQPVDLTITPMAGGLAAFNTATAQVDDIFFRPRTVQAIGGGVTGSTTSQGGAAGVVATRPTFRAVVADWRRGEAYQGNLNYTVSATNPSLADVATTGADGNRVSPGSQRDFDVVLNNSVTGYTGAVDGMGFPTDASADGLSLPGVSVTVIDPREVTFESAGFLNYPNDNQVPVGAVREFEVRVNFSAVVASDSISDNADLPAGGPTVEAISNWKLAEANVTIASQIGLSANSFVEHTPTEIGFVGITSETEVDVNTTFVRAQPLLGDNVRPLATVPPAVDPVTMAYQPATYEEVTRTFGPSFVLSGAEFTGLVESRDPGPAPNNQQTNEARAGGAPNDVQTRTVIDVPGQSIDIVDPNLFSIDPINPAGTGTPLVLNVGAGDDFRTIVQYEAGQPVVDRSLDYPPVAFFGTPAAGSSRGVQATGNLRVSGINAAGGMATLPMVISNVIGNPAAEIVVVAVDSVGEVITAKGMFADATGFILDSNGQAGNASSFTTINVEP